ncbi:MAG: hypothetical protein DI592_23690, partial [Stenotrophomonas maltophilia]
DAGRRRVLRLLLGTGVLGGFTTYSTLAESTAALFLDGHGLAGTGYALLTVLSGAIATALTTSPIGSVSATVTLLPRIESTVIDLPARFATRANRPVRSMARPDGWAPTFTVSITLMGRAVRSTTNSSWMPVRPR